jgi:hypothetical protein
MPLLPRRQLQRVINRQRASRRVTLPGVHPESDPGYLSLDAEESISVEPVGNLHARICGRSGRVNR